MHIVRSSQRDRELSGNVYSDLKKNQWASYIVRGGGTGQASPVLARLLFSDQVNNIIIS